MIRGVSLGVIYHMREAVVSWLKCVIREAAKSPTFRQLRGSLNRVF
jgi:hypothetical protein